MSVQGRTRGSTTRRRWPRLCAAVDRAVQAYRPEGLRVREVVVTLEEGSPALGSVRGDPGLSSTSTTPGYGHGI